MGTDRTWTLWRCPECGHFADWPFDCYGDARTYLHPHRPMQAVKHSVVEVPRLREAEAELARATTFTINLDADPSEWITVELTCVAGGGPHKPPHDTWAVRLRGYCLDVDGDWIYEPIPSSRDDEFLARTRWTREEAWDRARSVLESRGG